MSDLVLPSHGLFFGSALFNKENLTVGDIKNPWESLFGESIEFHHDFFPMKEYYSKQMGNSHSLSRIIFMSLTPKRREELVANKIWADTFEKSMTDLHSYRSLNLDIGLLTLENVSLATGKNFSHRTYLERGVFSDLNLQFENKSFKPLPWTYPDYSHPDFIMFFNWVRGFLLRKNTAKSS